MNIPAQRHKHQPGKEHQMSPQPPAFMEHYQVAGKLKGKVALVTGGDSGIGRAVCIGYAKEGADALPIRGDITSKTFCQQAVDKTRKILGGLNILVTIQAIVLLILLSWPLIAVKRHLQIMELLKVPS